MELLKLIGFGIALVIWLLSTTINYVQYLISWQGVVAQLLGTISLIVLTLIIYSTI